MEEDEEIIGVRTQGEEQTDLYKSTEDFTKYCQVDITDETKVIEDSIEEMLANLDEFSHLADTIRNDSSQILFVLLPELCTKCQTLPAIFNHIDQLGVFMERVKESVNELEDKVEQAEEELGSHSLKRVLNAIPYLSLIQKKQPSSTKAETGCSVEWQPPMLFKTSNYFSKMNDKEKTLDSEGITVQLETIFDTQSLSKENEGSESQELSENQRS